MIDELWEIEIAKCIKEGEDPVIARAFTIIRWAYLGDLRPLAVAINKGHAIDDAVLGFLADMIKKGRLQMKPKPGRRGSPNTPETYARDLIAGAAYEAKDPNEGSDEAFERIGGVIGVSPQVVRQAVTHWRKARNK
jgi:hypothetical protein